jgi:hypothetical protein
MIDMIIKYLQIQKYELHSLYSSQRILRLQLQIRTFNISIFPRSYYVIIRTILIIKFV